MTNGCYYNSYSKWISACYSRGQMKANVSLQKKYHVYRDLSGFISRILLYPRYICKFGKSCIRVIYDNFIYRIILSCYHL